MGECIGDVSEIFGRGLVITSRYKNITEALDDYLGVLSAEYMKRRDLGGGIEVQYTIEEWCMDDDGYYLHDIVGTIQFLHNVWCMMTRLLRYRVSGLDTEWIQWYGVLMKCENEIALIMRELGCECSV